MEPDCSMPRNNLAVRHQSFTDSSRFVDMTTDPLTAQGMALEVHNNLYCNILLAEGFDGNDIRLEFPTIKASETVVTTKPLSCERQDLIRKSKTAGNIFMPLVVKTSTVMVSSCCMNANIEKR